MATRTRTRVHGKRGVPRILLNCANCGDTWVENRGKNLCGRCFMYQWRHDVPRPQVPEQFICRRCKHGRNRHARGLCNSCYQKLWLAGELAPYSRLGRFAA